LGLSLSASGQYLAVSSRDGTLTVYEIVPGEAQSSVEETSGASSQSRARTLAESGDLEGAYRTLRAALDANPTDLALCEAALSTRETWLNATIADANSHLSNLDFASAIAAFEGILRIEPEDVEAAAALREARVARADAALQEAHRHAVAGEEEAAETA